MTQELVASTDDAHRNILKFEKELAGNRELAEIMSYGRAWYASRDKGRWVFGPSKFVGYESNTARLYLKNHDGRDGRLTERVLSQWSEEVAPGTALYRELHAALREMFARYGKSPNKLIRLNVLKADLPVPSPADEGGRDWPSRITIDTDICGGRPCIRGMRIRVSDVLDLLAAGNDRAQILADYPYLQSEDIDAVLKYAVRAVNHRVIKAA
ncbi:MAG TPA: DUF433 domain-containing protein [Rhizomicrobium sp.]|jgi:uncharacterized protein (DUF433 family)|nr:DUF433 domain-containing protein [Rhizomicrobium sp.]